MNPRRLLNLRPNDGSFSPNKGRGRLQRQVRRAFLIHGPVVVSSQVYDLCFREERQRRSQLNRRRVWQLLNEVAEVVGRERSQGAPLIWRLREPDSARHDAT